MAKKVEEKPALPQFLARGGDPFAAFSSYAAAVGTRLASTFLDYGYRLNQSLNKDGLEAMEGPLPLQQLPSASFPAATDYPGGLLLDTTGRRLAVSNGTAWLLAGGFAGPCVTDSGAVGNGVTDDTSAVAAEVLAAYTGGYPLFWPPGTYLTTASIPHLHEVVHLGPGAIKRGSDVFYVAPRTGQTNLVYVAASGTSGSDGLSASQPVSVGDDTWSAVEDLLANYGPTLSGTWRVKMAAGTYPGGYIHPRSLDGRNFVYFEGPSVGGHPNVPTALIDHGEDPSQTFGMAFTDGVKIDLKDIKFVGAFTDPCVTAARRVYIWFRNVHVGEDGSNNWPVVGYSLESHTLYFVLGGLMDMGVGSRTDLATVDTVTGISELFNCVRSFRTVSDPADQLLISNAQVAFKAKESCTGHLSYLRIDGANTGVELDSGGTANVGELSLSNCEIGIVTNDCEIHNDSGIIWGTGADACTIKILSRGSSRELDYAGWDANDGNPSVRTGQRPLIRIAQTYAAVTHAGSTSTTEHIIWNEANIIPAGWLAVEGKTFRLKITGRVPVGVTLVGTVRILARLEGQFLTDVTIPAGAAQQGWSAEFVTVSTSDGATQLATSTLVGATFYNATTIRRAFDTTTNDQDVRVSVIVANAADSITIDSIELWG